MNTIQVENARSEDVSTIAQIHVDAWRKAYEGILPKSILDSLSVSSRIKAWQERIKKGIQEVFVIKLNDQIIGFLSYAPPKGDNTPNFHVIEIYTIYLEPSEWGNGYGKLLYQYAEKFWKENNVKQVMLYVLEENQRARNFYERCGFKTNGETKRITLNIERKEYEVRCLCYQKKLY